VCHEVLGVGAVENDDGDGGRLLHPGHQAGKLLDGAGIDQVHQPVLEGHLPVRRRDLIDDESRRGFGGILSWLHRWAG